MADQNINNGALILFEGHGHDARFKGPLPVSPTVSAAYGEGGGNTPLVLCAAPAGIPSVNGTEEGDQRCLM